MSESVIILSICIPTFNRAKYLKETIDSIVKQDVFLLTNKVEIVISDNNSSDNTFEIVNTFIKTHGDKIRYFRNKENIHDRNFEKVLSLGLGEFLKLNNDTFIHSSQSLNYLLDSISTNFQNKGVLVFTNGFAKCNSLVSFNSLNELIIYVSYYITWIGTFGIWRTDLLEIYDFNKCSNLKLVQVDVLFNIINKKKSGIIYNLSYGESLNPKLKGGYDLLKVFFDNYFYILKIELKKGNIQKKIFYKEKEKILNDFLPNWINLIFEFPDRYTFTINYLHFKIVYYYYNNVSAIMNFYKFYYKKKIKSYKGIILSFIKK